MEVERQRYQQVTEEGPKGERVVVGERKVGGLEKFEFGMPNDDITMVVGGGYTSQWNPDFLQKELGKEGTCARFYFDKKVVVDVADPTSDVCKTKRKLLFKNGFGYLCVPSGFEKNIEKLKILYVAMLDEYRHYEKLHPRPAQVQEAIVTDEHGRTRRALMTAIDTAVGGGFTGNVEKQQAELQEAQKLSPNEVKHLRETAKLHRKIRECLQNKTPLRNPFIGPKKRLYPIRYNSAA